MAQTSLQTGVYTAAYLQIYVSDISLDDEGVVGIGFTQQTNRTATSNLG